MAGLQPGDIVRLTVDKTFEGTHFAVGTLGTLVAEIASIGACLVLLGHDTTSRLVPAGELERVNVAPQASPKGAKAKQGKSGLRFGLADRVKLREARTIGGVAYAKNSPGRIAAVLASFKGYLVDFDQDSTDRMLPDSALAPE